MNKIKSTMISNEIPPARYRLRQDATVTVEAQGLTGSKPPRLSHIVFHARAHYTNQNVIDMLLTTLLTNC